MENSLDTRIQHAVIGDTNNAGKTTATDDKPLRGEIVFNNTLTNFRVGINGNTAYSSLPDFLHVFTGANTSHAGTSGLVLAPSQKSSGDPDKFLCDDGSWKIVSSSGGTDTHYYTSLNGTNYGDTGGVDLGSWYAPATGGTSANQLLLSQVSNSAPIWTSLTLTSSTSGVFRWNSSAWELKNLQTRYQLSGNYPILTRSQNGVNDGDLSYFNTKAFLNHSTGEIILEDILQIELNPNNSSIPLKISTFNSSTETWSPIQNSLITCNGLITPNSSTDVNKFLQYTSNGFTWSIPSDTTYKINLNGSDSGGGSTLLGTWYAPTVSGTSGQLLISKGSSNAPNWIDVGEGLALNTSSTPNKLNLQQAEVYSASGSELGGVKVASVQPHSIEIQTSDSADTDNTHRYALHLCTNNAKHQLAYVYVPWTDTTYEPASINNGTNPGLLRVAADAEPVETYINDKYITAIPVFYTGDSVDNNTTFVYEEAIGEFDKDRYIESEEKFIGHYVNLYDVISGLIKNPTLLTVLRDALEIKQ